jgi:hypothetical protein
MKLNFKVHSRAGQSPALQAALDDARASKAAPSASSSDVRSKVSQRLGLTDPNASNEEIFAALDGTLAAAKTKRTQVDADTALYDAAFGDPRTGPEPLTFASAENAALYTLAFGKPSGA